MDYITETFNMSSQNYSAEEMTENIRYESSKLFDFIVRGVMRAYTAKQSFRDYYIRPYLQMWLKKYSGNKDEAILIAKEVFDSMIENNDVCFQVFSPKMKFLICLATECPVPKDFRELLENEYKFKILYNVNTPFHMPDQLTIDCFSMNDCKCRGKDTMKCVLNRSTFQDKCRWEETFDKKEEELLEAQGSDERATPQNVSRDPVAEHQVPANPETVPTRRSTRSNGRVPAPTATPVSRKRNATIETSPASEPAPAQTEPEAKRSRGRPRRQQAMMNVSAEMPDNEQRLEEEQEGNESVPQSSSNIVPEPMENEMTESGVSDSREVTEEEPMTTEQDDDGAGSSTNVPIPTESTFFATSSTTAGPASSSTNSDLPVEPRRRSTTTETDQHCRPSVVEQLVNSYQGNLPTRRSARANGPVSTSTATPVSRKRVTAISSKASPTIEPTPQPEGKRSRGRPRVQTEGNDPDQARKSTERQNATLGIQRDEEEQLEMRGSNEPDHEFSSNIVAASLEKRTMESDTREMTEREPMITEQDEEGSGSSNNVDRPVELRRRSAKPLFATSSTTAGIYQTYRSSAVKQNFETASVPSQSSTRSGGPVSSSTADSVVMKGARQSSLNIVPAPIQEHTVESDVPDTREVTREEAMTTEQQPDEAGSSSSNKVLLATEAPSVRLLPEERFCAEPSSTRRMEKAPRDMEMPQVKIEQDSSEELERMEVYPMTSGQDEEGACSSSSNNDLHPTEGPRVPADHFLAEPSIENAFQEIDSGEGPSRMSIPIQAPRKVDEEADLPAWVELPANRLPSRMILDSLREHAIDNLLTSAADFADTVQVNPEKVTLFKNVSKEMDKILREMEELKESCPNPIKFQNLLVVMHLVAESCGNRNGVKEALRELYKRTGRGESYYKNLLLPKNKVVEWLNRITIIVAFGI